MKKIVKVFTVAACVAATVACDKGPYPGYSKSESGIYYQLFTKSDGDAKPKVSDFVVVDLKILSPSDSLIFDSKKVQNTPDGGIMFPINETRINGNLEEGLMMMNKGDSASFIVLADSAYRGGQMPPNVIKGSFIKFFVKLINFRTKDDVMGEQKRMQEERQAAAQKAQQEEAGLRDKYIADNHITTKPTASGLYYIETKKGKGDLIKPGSTVTMKYTGKLLNGQVFDSSESHEGTPFSFKVDAGQVIPGWDEAVKLMRKGGTATLILPSSIAYGEQGGGPIPPFATLTFDVEVVDVK